MFLETKTPRIDLHQFQVSVRTDELFEKFYSTNWTFRTVLLNELIFFLFFLNNLNGWNSSVLSFIWTEFVNANWWRSILEGSLLRQRIYTQQYMLHYCLWLDVNVLIKKESQVYGEEAERRTVCRQFRNVFDRLF